MFKNKKFKKFVSALCSSLFLISVAPVIKRVYADPFYTIATDENGKTYLQPKEHTTFVIVSNCTDLANQLPRYKKATISTFGLDPASDQFAVQLLPEENVREHLLELLKSMPRNETVLLAVDLDGLAQCPVLHELPYSYAIHDANIYNRYNPAVEHMPATAQLKRPGESERTETYTILLEKYYVCSNIPSIPVMVSSCFDGWLGKQINIESGTRRYIIDIPASTLGSTTLYYFAQLHHNKASDLLTKLQKPGYVKCLQDTYIMHQLNSPAVQSHLTKAGLTLEDILPKPCEYSHPIYDPPMFPEK